MIRYIRGLGLISSDSEKAKTYYHYVSDEQGSITHVINGEEKESGELPQEDVQSRVLNHYEYDAFGNAIRCEEQVHNRFRYTGEQYDPLTGQYYLRARYYNPVIARFTQEDTYYGDGLNLYTYCQNNPILNHDPTGHGTKFGHPDTEVLREKFEAIREKAHKYYPEIQLYLGSELYYQQGTVSDLKQGKALTMNGTRYVLVEFATSDAYSHIYRAVQDFVYAGYIPILAHVERYKAVFGHVDKIVELIETGAYIQINAESLIGGIFDKRASFCKKIMKEGLVHFLGTDCHDFRTRRPNMKSAAEVVRKKHADQILYENPRRMLEGKSI